MPYLERTNASELDTDTQSYFLYNDVATRVYVSERVYIKEMQSTI